MNEVEVSLQETIKRCLKPQGNLDLIDWCRKNVYVTNSPKGNTIDLSFSPWFLEPYIEILTNPKLKEINVCSPVGSGKSALLLSLATTTVALYPKELMIIGQNEQQTIDFLDIHLKPAMKKNKDIARLWPNKKMDRRESIHFPHMSIYTGYATALNTLQSRSIDLLLMDEVWLYGEGVIEEARRRLHDTRPGNRMVNVSQGGIVGDQFHKTYSLGQIKKYAWKCDDCHNDNIYKFDDLKFEYQKEEDGTPLWASIFTEMECPHCKKKYQDNIETRRRLSEKGKYIIEDPNQNYLPNHVSYNFNQMAVYDMSWTQLVREFLTANNSNLRRTTLRQWEQKKMGVFYDESKNVESFDLEAVQGGYKMDDHKFTPWDVRIMTVDVQQDRMYCSIRDWSKEGASRLIAYNMASSFSDIERMRVEYNILPKCVFVDAAYRPEEVKLAGATYGWLGLNGLGDNAFKVKLPSGKTVERIFSAPVNYQVKTNLGLKNFQVANYSGVGVKDTLTTIQNNPNQRWEIPSDGENYSMYLHQLNSEIREINKTTGKPYYRKVKEQNHAFDTEVMQIVAAMIHKCLIFYEEEVE